MSEKFKQNDKVRVVQGAGFGTVIEKNANGYWFVEMDDREIHWFTDDELELVTPATPPAPATPGEDGDYQAMYYEMVTSLGETLQHVDGEFSLAGKLTNVVQRLADDHKRQQAALAAAREREAALRRFYDLITSLDVTSDTISTLLHNHWDGDDTALEAWAELTELQAALRAGEHGRASNPPF